MRIFLTNQQLNFEKFLSESKSKGIIPYEKGKLNHVKASVDLLFDKPLLQGNFRPLFDYYIFPKNIMNSFCEWDLKGRSMQVGDTIVQQIFIPPNKIFSQKIIAAVRIKEIINEENRIGFSYETIEGHVEKGISSFLIEKNKGQFQFTIETFSAPATALTRLLGPIFSKPYQAFCTKKALLNMKSLLELNS